MAIFDVPLDALQRRTSIKWRRFEPDVLPMFVAEMDAQMAEPVKSRLATALADGDTGYPELPTYQEAFQDYAQWQWSWRPELAEMKLATDVMTGMREVVLAVTEPGSKIAFNSPIYPPFRQVINNTGRTPLDIPLVEDRLDLAGIEAAFAQHRPAAYLLCSPHNPNGTIHSAEELAALAQLAAQYQVVVISDEIHAPLAGAAHLPYLAVPGVSRAVVVTSASKSWNLAAVKAALVVGDSEILAALTPSIHEGASHFGVLAHSVALTEGRDWLAQAAAEIAANKELLAAEVNQHLGLTYTPSAGTYLAWLDCAPLGLADPGKQFYEQGRVRFNHGTDFAEYAGQFVRVNLATSPEIIREAVQRMKKTLQSAL